MMDEESGCGVHKQIITKLGEEFNINMMSKYTHLYVKVEHLWCFCVHLYETMRYRMDSARKIKWILFKFFFYCCCICLLYLCCMCLPYLHKNTQMCIFRNWFSIRCAARVFGGISAQCGWVHGLLVVGYRKSLPGYQKLIMLMKIDQTEIIITWIIIIHDKYYI